MPLHFYLVDFENVQPGNAGFPEPGTCCIRLFIGQSQAKLSLELAKALQPFGAAVEYIQIAGNGPNALDFHIAFYIGRLAAEFPGASFTIVSRDTGFDPLVRHLGTIGITCRRNGVMASSASKAAPPAAATKAPTDKKSASTKNATKKTATKKAPAKNVTLSFASQAPSSRAAQSADASVPTQVDQAAKRLMAMKNNRPKSITALRASIASWFKLAADSRQTAAVVSGLEAGRAIAIAGTKVSYPSG